MNVTKLDNDGRKWFELDGVDAGTGIEFSKEVFALTADDEILDCDGCPLTPGDRQEVAVRNSI